MDVVLILYLCSAIQKTCMDPYIWPDRFYDNMGVWLQATKKVEKR